MIFRRHDQPSWLIDVNYRRAGHTASDTATVSPLWYPVIDAGTLSAHLVSEGALASGRRAGRFQAVCGDTVLAASLTAQERTHCQLCAQLRRGAQR